MLKRGSTKYAKRHHKDSISDDKYKIKLSKRIFVEKEE